MVKTVSSVMNDELHDEVVRMAKSIGLNRSQMVRYALAIVCGHPTNVALLMAKMPPDTSITTLGEMLSGGEVNVP